MCMYVYLCTHAYIYIYRYIYKYAHTISMGEKDLEAQVSYNQVITVVSP